MSTTTAARSGPAVRVRGASRRFAGTAALDDVTLDVPRDRVCGLLGRNGAGKTTLLSLLAGHDRPDAGTVEVLGEQPFENPRAAGTSLLVRDDQRYPDDFHLAHVLRVGPLFHPAWDAALAAEVVERFRIPAKPPVKKFSRGQRSALGVLLGLAARAPVTILDEPTLGLDATARAHFRELLVREMSEHPRTVVLSTHLVDEMEGALDRVLVLDRGRLVLDADVDEARERAHVVLGPAEAVERATAGSRTLASRRVGGFAEVVLEGPATAAATRSAGAAGLQVRPAGLQELVAALGAGDPPSPEAAVTAPAPSATTVSGASR
ncbi:ABC transporter ATP-binding protein [uncultured Pseudokineococcus sp.]|uniref:ABC transporter ATP-binding protein n=1 Tax=uncultured Pseudokineococcus sp. TaxID=1642928 RepID=UPI00261DAFCE|nr:ABC transporter ATP-binding protein [uncultured Pseudokineococcus sp.]